MRTVAVLLAAGKSERFGRDKLQVEVGGVPVWQMAFRAMSSHPRVEGVGIVASDVLLPTVRENAPQALFVVPGGATRTESARAGFANVPSWAEAVLFHDAARPFVSSEVVSRVVEAVEQHGAAFPCVPVTDTIKESKYGLHRTLERATLVAVQTPQGATVGHFRTAFEKGGAATDDAALLEAAGIPVTAVPGDPANIKLTSEADLARLPQMSETRTGIGYDVHRFSQDPGRELWLGGVRFEGEGSGLEGHSDADAVIHAIVDALLGAAGLGDIGELYPDTDTRWKGEPSATFLRESAGRIASLGWHVVNIDVTVLAERPRVAPKREELRSSVAGLVGVEKDRVSVKATTNERLGAIGRGEGVAAFAVATIRRNG